MITVVLICLGLFIFLGFYIVKKPPKKIYQQPKWSVSFVGYLFKYRYIISLAVILMVIGLGLYLHELRNWTGKDTIQVSTGLLILITLFFAALNYEFTSAKANRDYEAARNLLTYNTACEWHKNPMMQYQKDSIKHEKAFEKTKALRTIADFNTYINDPKNMEFKESLKGILNQFECVAMGVTKNMIDSNFIQDFYRNIFRIYYRDYYYYIKSERDRFKSETIWQAE